MDRYSTTASFYESDSEMRNTSPLASVQENRYKNIYGFGRIMVNKMSDAVKGLQDQRTKESHDIAIPTFYVLFC